MAISIRFRGVGYTANGRPVLRDLDFEVGQGETLVLLGRSGAGKSTVLKLINRILEPASGEILVEGKSTREWDSIRLRRRAGYVIQETGLFPHFTVERNAALVPTLEKWDPDRVRRRVDELLEMVGLPPGQYRGRFPRELSGGQKQRAAVARALAADPPILLMDEPFGALDPVTRLGMQREFAALAKRLDKTIVFVTHDLSEAFFLASRIGLLYHGKLVELLPPDQFRKSSHPEARAFLDTLSVRETP